MVRNNNLSFTGTLNYKLERSNLEKKKGEWGVLWPFPREDNSPRRLWLWSPL